jgi:CheY-like chemotaxis protein
LTDAGYQAVPAFNCDEALARIRQIGIDVDAAIISPCLPGAAELIETLRQDHGQLRIIATTEPGRPMAAAQIGAHAMLERPITREFSREEWVRKVKEVLTDGAGGPLS